MKFSDALNQIDGVTPDHGKVEIGNAFEKLREGVELLDWLMSQENLLWKTWHYMGGKQKTEVDLNEPLPHELQAEGKTVFDALQLAMRNAD